MGGRRDDDLSVGSVLPYRGPLPYRGASIRKRAGRRHGLRTSRQFVEHIDDFSSGDARRRTFQKIDERVFDHALCVGTFAEDYLAMNK